ncbi:hypothetical protein DFP73DRAFT_532083 [Morchella snyderi]|nr:hypothetical protein DFP73DRAFT_532083 [Morchella snyderi]
MILLKPRERKEEEEYDRISPTTIITVAVFLALLLILLLAGMVFCWRNPHWLSVWRRNTAIPRDDNGMARVKGLGIEGAGDLEESRPGTQTSELSYADLAREKELRREDDHHIVVPSFREKESSRVDVTADAHTTFPKPVASLGTPRLAMSKAIKYVTKEAQYLSIFHAFSRSPSVAGTPTIAPPRVLPPQLSPRRYGFRSARAAKKGRTGPKLSISAPMYGDLPPLTLSLPTMTLSWATYENGAGPGQGPGPGPGPQPGPVMELEPESPSHSELVFTDCMESLSESEEDAEEISTVDYEAFSSRGGEFNDYRRASSGKRLSFHSQMSGLCAGSDEARVEADVADDRAEREPKKSGGCNNTPAENHFYSQTLRFPESAVFVPTKTVTGNSSDRIKVNLFPNQNLSTGPFTSPRLPGLGSMDILPGLGYMDILSDPMIPVPEPQAFDPARFTYPLHVYLMHSGGRLPIIVNMRPYSYNCSTAYSLVKRAWQSAHLDPLPANAPLILTTRFGLVLNSKNFWRFHATKDACLAWYGNASIDTLVQLVTAKRAALSAHFHQLGIAATVAYFTALDTEPCGSTIPWEREAQGSLGRAWGGKDPRSYLRELVEMDRGERREEEDEVAIEMYAGGEYGIQVRGAKEGGVGADVEEEGDSSEDGDDFYDVDDDDDDGMKVEEE